MIKPSKKLEKPKPKPKAETKLPEMKKIRSPLADLNPKTTTCFRFLKSNSNSKFSTFPHKKSRKFVPNSAPPKNPPIRSNQNKQPKSNPSKIHQGFSDLTPPKSKYGSTPPIQASISPEIPCGSSILPTPICFAAGHVMTGVKDKRKCRPRGLLNVGFKENNEIEEFVDGLDKSRASRVYPSLPPLVKDVSVQWLSSPSKIVSEDLEPKTSLAKCLNDNEGFIDWLSEKTCPFSVSPVKFESSPLERDSSCFRSNSGPFLQKTPSSNSSLSPFSVILKRASKSSKFKQVELERETLCFTEIFESTDLDKTSENGGASFEFGNNAAPLKSVDLSRFRNPNSVSPESDKRISWREGLVSRFFEMGQTGQMDCCKWLSDCEDETEEDPFEVNTNIFKDPNAKCGFQTMEDIFEVNTKIFKDQSAKCGIKTKEDIFEVNTKICRDQCEFAESICLKGEDELVSSDDSDWRFLYQNQLFDV